MDASTSNKTNLEQQLENTQEEVDIKNKEIRVNDVQQQQQPTDVLNEERSEDEAGNPDNAPEDALEDVVNVQTTDQSPVHDTLYNAREDVVNVQTTDNSPVHDPLSNSEVPHHIEEAAEQLNIMKGKHKSGEKVSHSSSFLVSSRLNI